ncbi:vanadium-dependent haloperoxidase [Microbispora sp. NPDC046973]|uniref:vanadium-dependent haloperoxidase n=1 Tax=Microbispora sp. NPDC046973 TaxID=3155022 RepID=UPI003411AE2C
MDFTPFFAQAEPVAPATDAQKSGRSIGEQAAARMIATRAGDGSTDNTSYVPSTAPGQWRPTGSGAAATPNWGKLHRFYRYGSPQPAPDYRYPVDWPANGTLDLSPVSSSSARPQLPGGFSDITSLLSSQAYADQVNEVKSLGGATSTTRTAEQTQIAWFWANDLNGTYKPPGQLLDTTRSVSQQRGLSQLENTKLFSTVSAALADAAIVAWDAKYLTAIDLWRPESAIQLAADDGNAQTTPDASWQPLSADTAGVHFSPPFPAYISGHATFAGAWAASMQEYFGTDSISFTVGTEDPHAVDSSGRFLTRSFTSFSQAGQEDARSRIYLGVHYSWDGDYGYAAGRKLVGPGGELLADGTRTHTKLKVGVGYTYSAPSSTATPSSTYTADLSRYDSVRDAFNQCDYDGADIAQGQGQANSWACNVQYDGRVLLYLF